MLGFVQPTLGNGHLMHLSFSRHLFWRELAVVVFI